jgi:glutamate synthase (NADPH/NADH) large chain
MTSGRALVLGDPGPWMCAGMTGGTIYIRLRPDMNFDHAAVLRRIGRGANVAVLDLSEKDKQNIQELLTVYVSELANSDQHDEVTKYEQMIKDLWTGDVNFVKVIPKNQQVDQSVATE